jgi:hypothetical protein
MTFRGDRKGRNSHFSSFASSIYHKIKQRKTWECFSSYRKIQLYMLTVTMFNLHGTFPVTKLVSVISYSCFVNSWHRGSWVRTVLKSIDHSIVRYIPSFIFCMPHS